MAASECAQPGVHHSDCRCTVTGVPTMPVSAPVHQQLLEAAGLRAPLAVVRDTWQPMHPTTECRNNPCAGPHAIPDDAVPPIGMEADHLTVVCASCGRSVDKPGASGCEAPDWHRPQPHVPDPDVTAEDGDSWVPMDDVDWQAAVGPRPGQTWADLYGRTHVALGYKAAQLEGVTRELVRVRQELHVAQEQLRTHQRELDAFTTDSMRCMAAMVRAGGKPRGAGHSDDVLELRTPKGQLYEQQPGQLLWYDDPATDDRVWQVKP